MKPNYLTIDSIPAVFYGEPSENLFLYIHGKSGYKEEAEQFAGRAVKKGWRVLAVDLPGHGARKGEVNTFNPWNAVPELQRVLAFAENRYHRLSLFANSIGAWFSMQAFSDAQFERCLFVSPVLDMALLIRNMMQWAQVSEARLREEKVIPTAFGETLSYEYLQYAVSHPVSRVPGPTEIIYAGHDTLTSRDTVLAFAERFGCGLTIMEDGEHWFHTPEQIAVLNRWIDAHL
ncbi:MAG: alpha/beta hydrolase [Methanocorpusculum sp.]|nr:alpha/beta hydrolase [Methanocorpusculum sp.]